MPMRVHVHAAIWVGERLIVHRRTQRGREHVTLPGGRVREREAVPDALAREVGEEIGIEIMIGDLLLVGEVNGVSRQELVLVFVAEPTQTVEPTRLDLVDPGDTTAAEVMPPVLAQLAQRHTRPDAVGVSWLGNLYDSRRLA